MLKRLLRGFSARAVTTYTPEPVQVAQRLWALDRRVQFPGGAQLPIRSSILGLRDDSLVMVSAPPLLDSHTIECLNALGRLAAIVAPSTYHYLFVDHCCAGFPDATLYVAPGLGNRLLSTRDAVDLADVQPREWVGEVDYTILRGSPQSTEVLLFHQASASLIVTDAVFNLPRFSKWKDRVMWGLGGVPTGFGPARTSRKLLLCDPESVGECLHSIRAWPIERIVVSHGKVVGEQAKSKLLEVLEPFASV